MSRLSRDGRVGRRRLFTNNKRGPRSRELLAVSHLVGYLQRGVLHLWPLHPSPLAPMVMSRLSRDGRVGRRRLFPNNKRGPRSRELLVVSQPRCPPPAGRSPFMATPSTPPIAEGNVPTQSGWESKSPPPFHEQ